ncbi:MAG: hypothetical protein HZA46_16840 [Planctomycetales bacterium]|nr:hypothetical protein [Planctomycetales bacterium]
MNSTRRYALTLGPVIIIAVAYTVSFTKPSQAERVHAARLSAAGNRFAHERALREQSLLKQCGHTADSLSPKLPASCRIVLRPPFVIAGDCDEDVLERAYRETILPISNALWRTYFDHRPIVPITIVLLSNDEAYHDVARRLDGNTVRSYDGYYQRSARRMVLNISTGTGTLAHELCHALAEFDCPEMPEWFDEGLASLHEETAFTDDGLQLVGQPNWRLRLLPDAIRSGELPTVQQLLTRQAFRSHGEGLSYAHAQALCLYLQDRGLLAAYYRKLKANVRNDPRGVKTLYELLGHSSCEPLEREFVAWVKRQRP